LQLLLGHSKLESTVRYLGIEVDDALEISEQTRSDATEVPPPRSCDGAAGLEWLLSGAGAGLTLPARCSPNDRRSTPDR